MITNEDKIEINEMIDSKISDLIHVMFTKELLENGKQKMWRQMYEKSLREYVFSKDSIQSLKVILNDRKIEI